MLDPILEAHQKGDNPAVRSVPDETLCKRADYQCYDKKQKEIKKLLMPCSIGTILKRVFVIVSLLLILKRSFVCYYIYVCPITKTSINTYC